MQLNLLLTRLYNLLESNKKKYLLYPLWIYWFILFVLTSYPSDALPAFGVGDKFEHLIAYFVLSILIYLNFYFQDKYKLFNKRPALYTVLIGCVYGILDEIHQFFIPGRYFDLLDLAANFIGVISAVLIAKYFVKTVSQIKEHKS